MTLILNSNEIKHCIQFNKDLIPIIEDAFKSLSLGKTVMPPILRVDIEKYHGESDVKAAYIDGLVSYAIKIASGFFNNPNLGLPSSNGLMILLDSKTGMLKSVLLDKGYLTDVRTAIAGAIAAKHLSNPDSTKAGIIGAGIQAKLQLEALTLVRNIDTAFIWARNSEKVNQILSWYQHENNNVQKNIERLLNSGYLGGTGKLVILPVDQGFEHGPSKSFAPNPPPRTRPVLSVIIEGANPGPVGNAQ